MSENRESSSLPVVLKSHTYVTRGTELLIFHHAERPQIGLEVPGGTVDPGEDPDIAALRELHEETGIEVAAWTQKLGTYRYDVRPYRSEIEERHVYHVTADHLDLPASWVHIERHSGSGEAEIPLQLFWHDLRKGYPLLMIGQGALLPALASHLGLDH